MQTIRIPLNRLHLNKGQIEGLPKNPRIKKGNKYRKLMQSLKDDPEMLELRELIVLPYPNQEGHYIVIAGNMRLMALKELNAIDAPCKILPSDTPLEKLKAILIKDNLSYGDWDYRMIGEDWDLSMLLHYGMDLPADITDEDGFFREFNKTTNENAVYPLVPEFEEFHEVFIIMSDNEIDSNWLREKFGMQKMKSYKRDEKKKSNIIDIKTLKDAL